MTKSVRLRVLTDAGYTVELRHDVPATRDGCPKISKVCSHYRCRFNLLLVADDGKPWDGPRYTLRAYWLEPTPPETCSLRLAEQSRSLRQRGMNTAEISAVLNCHPTLTRRRVNEALRHLKALGVDVAEFQRVIDAEELMASE